jgi:hypothetical protein
MSGRSEEVGGVDRGGRDGHNFTVVSSGDSFLSAPDYSQEKSRKWFVSVRRSSLRIVIFDTSIKVKI